MATTVGTVYVDVKFNVGDVARQLQAQLGAAAGGAGGAGAAAAANLTRSFSQAFTDIGTKMQALGRQMSVTMTLPLALIGKSAVSSFQQFDKSMTQIAAINKVNAETTEAWRTEVRDLGKEYGVAAEEAAEGLYFITSSGVDAAHATEVLEVAMKASAVGFGETKVVADVLTSALSAYSKTGLTAAKVGDILAASVRLGKGEADDMAGSLSQVIPIAANLGVEFGEVAGAMAAMTLSGTSTDQAATQLRGLFNTLMDMPPIAQKALASYTGLDYATLRLKIESEGLIPILKQIFDGFGDNKVAMAEVFGNIRALTGVFNLFGQNTERTLDIIDQVTHASGELNDAWEITAQSKSKKFEKAMNNVHDAMIGLGSEIMPVISPIIEGVGTLAQTFGKLPGPIQASAVTLGMFAAAAGPVTFALGSMARGIGAIGRVVTSVAPTLATFGQHLANEARWLQEDSMAAGGLMSRLGGLKAAIGGAAIFAAGAAASYAIWSKRMGDAAERAQALYEILAQGRSGGGIKGIDEQIAAADKQIEGLRKNIRESTAPWDADLRAEWEQYINKLQEGNGVLQRRKELAQQVATATGMDAAAVADWMAEQYRTSGKTYTSVQEVKDALTEGYIKGEEGAKALADANGDMADTFGTVVTRAKEAADAFQGLIDAEQKVDDAKQGIVDANRKVTDAQEKYHDAQRKTIEADRKIVEAQRKVTDAVQATADARQRLVDAQKELVDAQRGEQEKLDLESAKIALAEAQKRLKEPGDALDRRRAQLDVRRAQLDLQRAQGAQAKRIVDAEKGVRDAQDGVTDAIQAEVDARQDVVDARAAKADASRDEAEAFDDIATAQAGVKTAEENLLKATMDYKFVQDALNQSIEKGEINGNAFLTFLANLAAEQPAMAGTIDGYTTKFNEMWRAIRGEDEKGKYIPSGDPYGGARPPSDRLTNLPQASQYDMRGLIPRLRAAGGPLSAGQLSQVNERQVPELWSAEGKQYLLPTDEGRVVPLKPLDINVDAKGGDGISVGDIYVQGAEHPVQTAYEVRRQLRVKTRTKART